MSTPLHRLYKTKLALLAWIALTVGAGLLFLAAWADSTEAWAWLTQLPAAAIGETLLSIGLIAIIFEFANGRDAEERDKERLRAILREEAPAIRDAVVQGFAFTPDSLANVASTATLDRVVENCLALRLGDPALASEVYTDLKQQVAHAASRFYNARASVALAPWAAGPKDGSTSMFIATIRWEYEADLPTNVARFSCVSSEADYRQLLQDPASMATWLFMPTPDLNGAAKEVFELVQFTVDGKEQAIRRTARGGNQTYSVHLAKAPSNGEKRRHKVAYTFRVLVRREGRLLHLDIARPMRGLKIELFYGGCGIQNVKVLDYIAAAAQPRISRLPATSPTPSVVIDVDGWVWPKSGVGFVWTLENRHTNALAP